MKYNTFMIESGKCANKYVICEPPIKLAKIKYEDIIELDTTKRNCIEEYDKVVSSIGEITNEMCNTIIPRGVIKLYESNEIFGHSHTYLHFTKNLNNYIITWYDRTLSDTCLFEGVITLNSSNLISFCEKARSILNLNADNKVIVDAFDTLFSDEHIKLLYKNIREMSFETYNGNTENIILDVRATIINIMWFLVSNLRANKALLDRSVTYIESSSDCTRERKENNHATDKEEKRTVVNLGNDIKVYINDKKSFSKYIKTTTRNITCSFNVCGHWRYYRNKDGSVRKKVWIEGFIKGQGKPFKGKTYILPDTEKKGA